MMLLFRMFEAEAFPTHMRSAEKSDNCMETLISKVGESIHGFQTSMGTIETEARKLIKVPK